MGEAKTLWVTLAYSEFNFSGESTSLQIIFPFVLYCKRCYSVSAVDILAR